MNPFRQLQIFIVFVASCLTMLVVGSFFSALWQYNDVFANYPTFPAISSRAHGALSGEPAERTRVLGISSVADVPIDSIIKGSSSSVYYYTDGFRYLFPSEKIFNSWFADYKDLVIVSDETLSALPLKSSVTYRPGVRLIKTLSSAKVYSIDTGGVLRWIQGEVIAEAVYGSDWNKKIDDVPEIFLTSYDEGDPISEPTTFVPERAWEAAPTINQELGIQVSEHTPRATTPFEFFGFPSSDRASQPFAFAQPAATSTPTTLHPTGATSTPSITASTTPTQAPSGTSPATPAIPLPGDGSAATPAVPATPLSLTPTTTPTSTPPIVDTVAPVISGVATSDVTTSSATVGWTTDEASDSLVEYGLTTAYGTQVSSMTLVTSHSLTMSDLTASTIYHFRIKSKDGADNTAATSDYEVMTTTVTQTVSPPQFVLKWGSRGTGNGQFVDPFDVAVDGSGNVYVADTTNRRIQKFDASGNFLTKWGTQGTGDGQFGYPAGIEVDASGNVYVADQTNHRIQKFDANGNYLMQFGSNGTGNGQFNYTYDNAVDSGGNIYVTDASNNRVQKFNASGEFVLTFGSYGTSDGQFYRPGGLAVDASGNVYVADYNHRVQKFDSSGNFLMKIGNGVSGSSDGQLSYPEDVDVDSSGTVYVLDSGNYRVQVFSSSGGFLTKWGSRCYLELNEGCVGGGSGQFLQPDGIDIDSSGNIYVADTSNQRIQKFR